MKFLLLLMLVSCASKQVYYHGDFDDEDLKTLLDNEEAMVVKQ